MANEILYQCSNCGKTEQTRAALGVPDGMFYAGYRAHGDVLYCPDYEIRRAASDADMQKRLDKFILRHNVDSVIRSGRLNLIISPNALEAFCVEFGINEIINCKIIDCELNVEVKALFDKMPSEYDMGKYDG